jgi:hypothetical protein
VDWENWSERSDRIALVASEVSNNRCWLWAEPRIASDTGTGVIAPCFGEERGVALEFNVLALIKGDERYVYVYDDESRATLVEMFHEQAADPKLTLNWFDAAVLAQKAAEQAASQPEPAVKGRF